MYYELYMCWCAKCDTNENWPKPTRVAIKVCMCTENSNCGVERKENPTKRYIL